MKFFLILFSLIIFNFYSQATLAAFREINEEECLVGKNSIDEVLKQVKEKNPNAISSLAGCLRTSHKLIFKACVIDPSQLAKAEDIFRNDENFINRLIKVNPEILLYASKQLRSDNNFVERASYINRDALKYADESLLDNKIFMKKMIDIDARNYLYASNRIKAIKDYAKKAFLVDGDLILYAPQEIQDDKELVKIALKSSTEAFNFLNDDLKKDNEITKIIKHKNDNFSKEKLENFLKEKYLKNDKKYIGKTINKNFRLHKKNTLIEKNYITKWHRSLKFNGFNLQENIELVEAKDRNYNNSWKNDLKKYPDLIVKIENFLKKRYIDKDAIDNLYLTYLWKIKDQPATLAFNLYLLRESNDSELGKDYVSATSLTAIAVKTKNSWQLNIVDIIFGNEIKIDIAYKYGHKKYILQDLYFEDKNDKEPKIIFRVEDKFEEYFEIFGKQSEDKYKLIYRINPLKIKDSKDLSDDFEIKRTREEQEEYDLLKEEASN